VAVTSEVGIYNLALNAVGERSNVSSPTEKSRRAEVCNLWYDTVRDQVLEAAPWPEATAIEFLALKAQMTEIAWAEGDPRSGYTYAYTLPADCLRPQYLDNFSPFMLTERDDERLLHTEQASATLVYTSRQENISMWSTSLKMAIAYGLAAHIAMPLSGKPARAARLAEQANELITVARVNAANSGQETYESIPDWIQARGYNTAPSTRYFFPTGGMLNVN